MSITYSFNEGVTFGAWDLLHVGHMLFLNAAKSQCRSLTVCLQVDPSDDRAEKNSPVQSLIERYLQLDQFLRDTDYIIPYERDEDIKYILEFGNFDIRFIGSDYKNSLDKIKFSNKTPILFLDRNHDFSTSNLRKRIFVEEAMERIGVNFRDPL